jgi:hypothetical protein
VEHSRLEEKGKRHKCAFNYVSNQCECKCWHTKHYLNEGPNAQSINFNRDNFSWKNLVFHEAATGSKKAAAWKLLNEGQKYSSIGYHNPVRSTSSVKSDSPNQQYWNNRNYNLH